MTKICKQCEESKPLAAFSRHPRAKDGLTKTCTACLSAAGKARYTARMAARDSAALSVGKETREQQNGSQRATQALIERTKNLSDPRKTFQEITKGLETPSPAVPNIPWPFRDDWDLTEELGDATDGILIALLHGDSLGSQLLLEEVCKTWVDAVAIQSHIIEILIKIALSDTDKERQIQICQGMIRDRETLG